MFKNYDLLFRDLKKPFFDMFGVQLDKFVNPLWGFDVVGFDIEVIKSPDNISMRKFCNEKYGVQAMELIDKLLYVEAK